MLADRILGFLQNIRLNFELPPDVQVLYPFADAYAMETCTRFYQKFYADDQPRYCIIGINPGRFGGGVTGVPFTDPIRLAHECGIPNEWPPRQELSSVFVYDLVQAFGGVEAFYKKFYITAISPLGFTASGKNLNYYDNRLLLQNIKPFSVACFREQLSWGLHASVAFCLGEGTNFKYLSKLNNEYRLFDKIIALPHPRFIMQYRLKQKEQYIVKYLEAFQQIE
ncbi:DUF4918 family protein [Segetibacter sp. 3557_3]|uniref:uracil-DNA glycosylase family protein n=1 Tax=Segetibacter sp. 3557_3 TaxID=2547429 RepID=UPI0010589433|nr:uracil-DNA glycosylase family protein [Segetibacter sp. 3557_3]TDH25212.1 DUF4918 family protein [Segetibacter sp. 3557_3]